MTARFWPETSQPFWSKTGSNGDVDLRVVQLLLLPLIDRVLPLELVTNPVESLDEKFCSALGPRVVRFGLARSRDPLPTSALLPHIQPFARDDRPSRDGQPRGRCACSNRGVLLDLERIFLGQERARPA